MRAFRHLRCEDLEDGTIAAEASNDNHTHQPSFRWLRAGTILVPLVTGLIWGFQIWQGEWRLATATARKNAELASEYTVRLTQTQQILLDRANALLEQHKRNPDISGLARQLSELSNTVSFTRSIVILDESGRVIAASADLPSNMRFHDRRYFRALQAQDIPLFVDRLVLQPSGADALLFARRLKGDGFIGIVATTVELPALRGFFQSIAPPGEDMIASVITQDGRLLIRSVPGFPITLPPDTDYMQAIQSQRQGVLRMKAVADGVKRLYAFRAVDSLPVIANFGIEERRIYSAIAEKLVVIAAFLLVSAALGYFAVGQVLRRMRADFDRSRLIQAERDAALKETLLKEVNHRIKNNLSTVLTLIHMQKRQAKPAINALEELEKRIWAIAEVHDMLYKAETSATVDFLDILHAACRNPSVVPPESSAKVSCEGQSVSLNVHQAVPAALILLELITNALKHAFPHGRQGSVAIALRTDGDMVEVAVFDDGVGMPEILSRRSGTAVIERLARQIGGTLSREAGSGTRMVLRFPLQWKVDDVL